MCNGKENENFNVYSGIVKTKKRCLSLTSETVGTNNTVTVAVRVRPFANHELELKEATTQPVLCIKNKDLIVWSGDPGASEYRFTFDHCFQSLSDEIVNNIHGFSDQALIYGELGSPLLARAFEGYNVCLFAYGATGSGKSHTITGFAKDPGVVPRFVEELFLRREILLSLGHQVQVEVSFFEIYNERIHDLLSSSHDKSMRRVALRVREHPVNGPYVEGLASYVVGNADAVRDWLTLGNKQRATAATAMNDKSSRSHSICALTLTQIRASAAVSCASATASCERMTSKANLVDLAGSERQARACTSGLRLREACNINKSLLTLGKVISMLADPDADHTKCKRVFIPYRDSVLTWLLRESLGGNSHTVMIATVSPSVDQVEETLNTLRYASQARSIVNLARINEDPCVRQLREMRLELERLRERLAVSNNDGSSMTSTSPPESSCNSANVQLRDELDLLRQQLADSEQVMRDMERVWKEKLQDSEIRRQEEMKRLVKEGLSVNRFESADLPALINLNGDSQLSGALVYPLRLGDTLIKLASSSGTSASVNEICLTGAHIAERHCTLRLSDAYMLTVLPLNGTTFVNGRLINTETSLKQGDRLVLGKEHFFRIHDPRARDVLPDSLDSAKIPDFEQAHAELEETQAAVAVATHRADSENQVLVQRIGQLEEQLRAQSASRGAPVCRAVQTSQPRVANRATTCLLKNYDDACTQTLSGITGQRRRRSSFSDANLLAVRLVDELSQLTAQISSQINVELAVAENGEELVIRLVSSQDCQVETVWSLSCARERIANLRAALQSRQTLDQMMLMIFDSVHQRRRADNLSDKLSSCSPVKSTSFRASLSLTTDLPNMLNVALEDFSHFTCEPFTEGSPLAATLRALESVELCFSKLQTMETQCSSVELQAAGCRLLAAVRIWLHLTNCTEPNVEIERSARCLVVHLQQALRAQQFHLTSLLEESCEAGRTIALRTSRTLGTAAAERNASPLGAAQLRWLSQAQAISDVHLLAACRAAAIDACVCALQNDQSQMRLEADQLEALQLNMCSFANAANVAASLVHILRFSSAKLVQHTNLCELGDVQRALEAARQLSSALGPANRLIRTLLQSSSTATPLDYSTSELMRLSQEVCAHCPRATQQALLNVCAGHSEELTVSELKGNLFRLFNEVSRCVLTWKSTPRPLSISSVSTPQFFPR